jgi:hypothetical protein
LIIIHAKKITVAVIETSGCFANSRASQSMNTRTRRMPMRARSPNHCELVDAPFGKRPFRVHVDPSHDGAEILNGVADRVRAEMFRRIGLEDLLHPAFDCLGIEYFVCCPVRVNTPAFSPNEIR